uniref:Calcineurin-like phosphoesterase domain-containing protein n=1 Tax=Timspurckia oligopyrenoides TaxID=708627 RepID=A0A7S0ZJ91_9RHOD|mmetsp:Transcript_7164/g.12905  ORF Transcript_7164/g.12905 Transcript_7164/m.12905 type:complete len:327 (+) Transcript_7164:54-1034(+)|eukprot:CAMPEP_0182448754 /NCGR_PEP_ID=MMETSP1172-20130603/29419_1 /TAXON_ID=708627 /ORGANISM="Timspurckia oligopyrenoides, Strain CCMP3278" /LENGTH=326 /DNA_ID=CAMNT_0024645731 /DNA_START=30 /DNA_END=1010 /DNA_ORIENTATION=+
MYEECFKIGICADIQYADKLNHEFVDEFGRTRVCFYKNSIEHVKAAVQYWKNHKVDIIVQLGDLIDGYKNSESDSIRDLHHVLSLFNTTTSIPLLHVLGNHCRSVSKSILKETLFSHPINNDNDAFYYAYKPHPKWKFIVLNGAEISTGAIDSDFHENQEYDRLCEKYSVDSKFRNGWTGIISEIQSEWLESELESSRHENEYVLVFCHYPICGNGENASPKSHLLANSDVILEIMNKYSDIILAFLSGHDHIGSYTEFKSIHHITLPSILEFDPNKSTMPEENPGNPFHILSVQIHKETGYPQLATIHQPLVIQSVVFTNFSKNP